jgi:hypothetical protein
VFSSRRRKRRQAPNNAFKPKLHRYANNMAGRACHVAGYALQFGLTWALGGTDGNGNVQEMQ